jgi:hypothetical protein
MDPNLEFTVQNARRKTAQMKVKEIIELVEKSGLAISANGVFI